MKESTRFSALLAASLACLMLSGQALAGPRFLEREIFAREGQALPDFGSSKWEDREPRKDNRQQDKKDERKAEDEGRERGYGYGYERRYPQPRQNGGGGRR